MHRWMNRLNPYIIVLYYTLIMVFGVLIKHPLHLSVILIAGIIMAGIVAGVRPTARMLGYALIMAVLIILINPLVSKEGMTKIIEWGSFYVTKEAVLYGVMSAMMLTAVFMWFVSFNVIMTSDKYIYVLGRFLPSLSILISLTLRLIPALNEEYQKEREYALSLGMYSDKGVKNRISLSAYALRGVVRRSIENSSIRADSMEARGYGITHRSSYLSLRANLGDIVYLVLTIVLGVLVILGHIYHYDFASYYPIVNIDFTSTYTIVSLVIMMMFVALPIGGEVWEEVRWKRYLLRISA